MQKVRPAPIAAQRDVRCPGVEQQRCRCLGKIGHRGHLVGWRIQHQKIALCQCRAGGLCEISVGGNLGHGERVGLPQETPGCDVVFKSKFGAPQAQVFGDRIEVRQGWRRLHDLLEIVDVHLDLGVGGRAEAKAHGTGNGTRKT